MIFSFRGVASDSRYVRTKEIDVLGLYSKLKITITITITKMTVFAIHYCVILCNIVYMLDLTNFCESLDEFSLSLDEFSSLDEFLCFLKIRQVKYGCFQTFSEKM